jgi:NAD(P)-dependent dehydrogenase (short-subunit alcohol dehydrogenase family)
MEGHMADVMLVTGGGRGIGAAVALLAARRGFDVAVNYREDERAAASVADAVRAVGMRATTIQADVSREPDIVRMFQQVDTFGTLRALVNNAGVTGGFSKVADLSAAALGKTLAVNTYGAILCAREAVRRLSTVWGGNGGAIVNVSSIASRLGGAGEWVHYAASKGAIETFTLGLAREVAGEGVRVNAVSPGIVDTEIHATAGDPHRAKRMAASIPIGRAATANEVAESIMWLLSPESSYITGSILEVGGGR